MITTTLVFDRRKKASNNEKGMVEIRITLHRKSYYISTGVRVLKKKWGDGYVINQPDAPELNERLRLLVSRANAAANEYIANGKVIDPAAIKAKVLVSVSEASGSDDLLKWIGAQIDGLRLAEGTLKHYRTLDTRLTEYGQLKRWSDLTVENIYAWDAWLHELPGDCDGKISDGGVYNYHKTLKALLNKAVLFGKIDRNPYDMLKKRFKRGDRENVEYLTEEEMAAVRDLELATDSELGKARDVFVFQLYTGLSFSDAQAFKISDYRQEDGRWRRIGERIKTGVPFVSELLPPAVAVLERNGWKLPKLSNQACNRALKVVGEMAGITIPLHSHLARHSFATMMLRNGAKIENVSRMLGHTNIRQTQRYAKVLAQSVHDDYEMVAEKLK